MTGFADGAFLQGEIDSETVAMAAFATFFVTHGLPWLIFVDADGVFAGVFKQLFRLLQIPVEPVARENHKAVRNERFHHYLNKVQHINTADMMSLSQWKQGTLFSLYGWNVAPIDGTDVPRSVAAVGRDFPFPINLSPAMASDGSSKGQNALDYLDAASPLLFKQRQLLEILNQEQCQRHTELRNEGIRQRTFDPGDLVIVRKQVKSVVSQGISAKLLFRAKGLYQVTK